MLTNDEATPEQSEQSTPQPAAQLQKGLTSPAHSDPVLAKLMAPAPRTTTRTHQAARQRGSPSLSASANCTETSRTIPLRSVPPTTTRCAEA
jgi:hypothetical protein